MAKILVGILSCKRDLWFHKEALRMWIPTNRDNFEHAKHVARFRFFVGEGSYYPADSVCLVNTHTDDAKGTPKVRHMIKEALGQGFDYLFKCDIDTFVRVRELLSSGFDCHEWSGGYGSIKIGPYGGSGYWLNRRAMLALQSGNVSDHKTPRPWDEDRWVGANLLDQDDFEQKLHLDWRYDSIGEPHTIREDFITSHLYARHDSYSGPVAPPPVLLNANDRMKLMHKYYDRFKETAK